MAQACHFPDVPRNRHLTLAAIPVRGDAGGLFFAIGLVAILLALPQLRWFLIASVICAAAAGYALIAWSATPQQGDTSATRNRHHT